MEISGSTLQQLPLATGNKQIDLYQIDSAVVAKLAQQAAAELKATVDALGAASAQVYRCSCR